MNLTVFSTKFILFLHENNDGGSVLITTLIEPPNTTQWIHLYLPKIHLVILDQTSIRSFLSKLSVEIALFKEGAAPAPKPSIKRSSISEYTLSAKILIKLARVKITNPQINIGLRPYRSDNGP